MFYYAEQTEKLLSVLSRRTSEQFVKFLDALDATGQQHVRSHITAPPGIRLAAAYS